MTPAERAEKVFKEIHGIENKSYIFSNAQMRCIRIIESDLRAAVQQEINNSLDERTAWAKALIYRVRDEALSERYPKLPEMLNDQFNLALEKAAQLVEAYSSTVCCGTKVMSDAIRALKESEVTRKT